MIRDSEVAAGSSNDPGVYRDQKPLTSDGIDPRQVTIEEAYDLWAPIYDATPNPLLGLEARTLAPLFDRVAGSYVLDVACGTGRWLYRLLEQGAREGVGVDFSAAMLAVAATKAELRGRLVRATCVSLPFRSDVADLIVCSFAAAHLPDLPAFAGELSRLAKCGADLYLTDVHPEGLKAGWRSSFRSSHGVVEVPTYPRSVDQILRAFAVGGFELVDCLEPHFEEPDRPVFVKGKKAHLFEEFRQLPAVLICHFTRSYRRRPLV